MLSTYLIAGKITYFIPFTSVQFVVCFFLKYPENVVSKHRFMLSQNEIMSPSAISCPRRYETGCSRICFHFLFLKGACNHGDIHHKFILHKKVRKFFRSYKKSELIWLCKHHFPLIFLHNHFISNQTKEVRH